MFRRLFAAVTFAMIALSPALAPTAHAQQLPTPAFQLDLTTALNNVAESPAALAADQLSPRQAPIFAPAPATRSRSSALLFSLYASTAAMQALDVHSTLRAFSNGAVEGNPLMAGVAGNKAAFMAVKATVAVSTILAARNMAKRNKVAAIATLVAVNAAYAFVVDHNYRVARR
jgi:hypothetical protein